MVKDDETEKVGAGGEIAVKDEDNHILISISGTIFALDVATIMAIGSAVLMTMVNPNSGFQIPRDNVYHAVADPESFSCIVHLARFGKLPDVEDVSILLEQADYWGVTEAIEKEIADLRIREKDRLKEQLANAVKRSGDAFENAVSKAVTEIEASKHHNYRRIDGNGRVHCIHCKCRAWLNTFQRYTCKNCRKSVKDKPDLGWCHKCQLCDKCQQRKGALACPNSSGYIGDFPIKPETNNEAPLEEFSRLVINNIF